MKVSGWVAIALFGLIVTGCATTVDGSSTVDSGQVRAYQSDVSVAAEESRIAESSRAAQAARTVSLALCSQFTATVVTMLNSYNQFVTELNEVQSYSATNGGGQVVIDQLVAGEQAISAKLVADIEQPVDALVRAFLARNTELIAAVREELRSGLNEPADRWIDARNEAVEACGKLAP